MNYLEIKENRKRLGLTQQELADLLGVSKNTIVNYEKGMKIPDSKIPILNKVLNKNTNIVLEPSLNYNTLPGYNKKKNERIDEIINQLIDLKELEPDHHDYSKIIKILSLQIETLEVFKIAKINHLNEK